MRDELGHLGRRATAEAIGTFFLVFIGTGAIVVDARTGGAAGLVGIALAFAFVILAMVYAIGHLSGGHVNPAVTIAFWSARRFPGRDAVVYVVAQCVGAVAASLLLRAVVGPAAGYGETVPALPTGAAFVVEFVLSFALMFVVAAVATDDRVSRGVAGLAVGLVVGMDVLAGGPLTGASMNPARSLGPAVASGVWTAHGLYWAAPVAGMIAAARAYELLRPASAPHVEPRESPLGVPGPIDRD